MFAVYGVEGTSRAQANEYTWRKSVTADVVEFRIREFNERTETTTEKIERIRQEEPCVFRREHASEVEKLGSRAPVSSRLKFEIINLREASRFEVDYHLIVLEGPSVYCPSGYGYGCQNSWNQMIGKLEKGDWTEHDIARRKKAITLIKRTCPGKPY